MNDISEILNQLGNDNSNPYNENIDNEPENTQVTLSDIISTVHKSFVNSQHNIKNTELESFKKDYNVSVNMNSETLSSKMLTIDGESIPQHSLTKQNSLSIGEVDISLKMNLCDIIQKNNNKEITVSKYDENGEGFPTDFKIKLSLDNNLNKQE